MSTAEGNLNFRSTLDDSQFQAAIGRMEVNVGSMTDQITNQNGELETFAKKMTEFANSIFSFESIGEFVKSVAKVRGEYQQLEITFSTLLKSKSSADVLMANLSSFAGRTPFGLKETADAARQMLVYGSSTKTVMTELKMLGEVAIATSSPIGNLANVYSALKSKENISLTDVDDLAKTGIPIYEELAEILSKSKEKVSELVSTGQVGFPLIEEAFQRMTNVGGSFYGVMSTQSQTLNGQLEHLNSSWETMLNTLGQNQEGLLGNGIEAAIALVDNYERVIEAIQGLVIIYGAYKTALAVTNIAIIFSATATNSLGAATRVWSAIEVLQYGILVAKEKIITVLTSKQTALMLSTAAYTAVIGALVAIGYSYLQYQDAAEIAEESLEKARRKGAVAFEDEEERIKGLINIISDYTRTKVEQKAAYDELNATTNGVLEKYSLEAVAAGGADGAIRSYLNSVKSAASVESEYSSYKELEKKLKALNTDGIEAVGTLDKLWISLKRTFAPTSQGLSWSSWLNELTSGSAAEAGIINDRKNTFLNAQKDILKGKNGKGVQGKIAEEKDARNETLTGLKGGEYQKFNNVFAQGNIMSNFDKLLKLAPNKAALTKLKGTTEGIIDALAPGDESILNYRKKVDKLDKVLKQYSSQNKPVNPKNDERKKFLEELKREAGSGSKTEEEGLQGIINKYAGKLSKAKEIKAGSEAISIIKQLQVRDTDKFLAEKDIMNLKGEISSKKTLFAEYEEFKTKVGKEEADKRFKLSLNNFEDYGAYLRSKEAELNSKKDPTVADKKKLAILSDESTEFAKQKQDQETERFVKAYKEAETFAQKKLALEKDFDEKVRALKKGQGGKIDDEQLKNLKAGHDAGINAAKEEAFQKSVIYKKLSKDTLILTREQIEKQIATMRSLLDDPSITGDVKSGIAGNLKDLEVRLHSGVGKSNFQALERRKNAIVSNLGERSSRTGEKDPVNEKAIKDLNAELVEVKSKMDDINARGLKGFMNSLKDNKALQGLSTGLGLASDAASMMSQALGGVDTEAGYTMDTIGQLAGAAGDLAGSIVSGDPAKIVGSAIKAVGTLFSIGKRVREMNEKAKKEVADFYSNAIKGEREYQDSLKERALQRVRDNKTALNGIKDELKIRQDQMAGWKQESEEIMGKLSGMSSIASETYKHGTWFRKAKVIKTYESLEGKDYGQLSQLLSQGKLEGDAKALVERLKELEQKGFDAEKAIADLAKQTNEIFTGTNSDNLTNSLLGMFKEGKTGAQDLADFFKQTMDDAALSIFKNKILAGAMENFYKEFAKRGVSGEELTDTEISELEGIFNNSMANAAKEYEALKKITGRDPSSGGAGPSGLTGASSIKREITEETAGVLTGLWRGQFDLTKQLVTLSMERNAVVNTVGVNAMELLNVARSNFDVALKIESNTYRTANNTDGISGKLDQIIVNTQPSMGTRSLG
ncbi:tape measure protein [Pedobacter sp. FW305-3-2-15-E-R2A2]|uniref:tape measure protein n=1 Tax=Pedobacter sp. FW305-3-2-15-E-R2A2 TaxID=3140251 RepID=UPI00314059D0